MEVARRLGVLILEWGSLALGVFLAKYFGFLHYGDPVTLAVVAIVLGQAVLLGDWRLIVYGALF